MLADLYINDIFSNLFHWTTMNVFKIYLGIISKYYCFYNLEQVF